VHLKTDNSWSREQIASGLRLVAGGVPERDMVAMMGVSPVVLAARKRNYERSFLELTELVDGKRISYMSDWAAPLDQLENELRDCRIPFALVKDKARVIREALQSNKVIANLQPTFRLNDVDRVPAMASTLALVSVTPLHYADGASQNCASSQDTGITGALSAEINELRWRTHSKTHGTADELISQDLAMMFSLEAILSSSTEAIRIFYTSGMDALLLGNWLVEKTVAGNFVPKR
jgi:hypothetical protein